LEHNVHGVANGNKNSNGVFLGGSDMVNVQNNLSPDPLARRYCKIISHHSRAGDLGSSILKCDLGILFNAKQ